MLAASISSQKNDRPSCKGRGVSPQKCQRPQSTCAVSTPLSGTEGLIGLGSPTLSQRRCQENRRQLFPSLGLGQGSSEAQVATACPEPARGAVSQLWGTITTLSSPPLLPTGHATSAASAASDLRGADSLQDWGRGRILGVRRLVAAAPIGENGVFPPAGVFLSVELSGVSLHCFLSEGQSEEGGRDARVEGGGVPPNLCQCSQVLRPREGLSVVLRTPPRPPPRACPPHQTRRLGTWFHVATRPEGSEASTQDRGGGWAVV